MNRITPCWGVAPAILLGAATLTLADDVSLVGDFRLEAQSLRGTVSIDDSLTARVTTAAAVGTGTVTKLSGGKARLSLELEGSEHVVLTLTARRDGSLDVFGGGTLRRQGTFPTADVERSKAFLQANASSWDNLDCLTTVNRAVRILFRDQSVRVGSRQDLTMNGLGKQGLADPAKVIEFFDAKGRKTTGVTEPETLRESAWEALLTLSKREQGWSVFGLSIMDGYHSVLLFLDNTDPAAPRVYWADQWSSKGGFKEYDKEGLDGELESKTNSWWTDSKKPRSRTTLWRLRPEASGKVQLAVVNAPRLNLRSGPSTDDEKIGKTFRNDRFQVVDKSSAWRRIVAPDGAVSWAHGGYLRFIHGVPGQVSLSTDPAVSVQAPAAGITSMIVGTN